MSQNTHIPATVVKISALPEEVPTHLVGVSISTGQTAKIVAMTSKCGSTSSNSVIALEVNGVNQYSNGYSVQMSQGKGLIEFLTPYELVSGDVVNFKTQAANTTSSPNTATLWIMYSPIV